MSNMKVSMYVKDNKNIKSNDVILNILNQQKKNRNKVTLIKRYTCT